MQTVKIDSTAFLLLCSGVEDLVRWRPDLKDMARPSDSITALHLASARDRLYVVRHLALSVRGLIDSNMHGRKELDFIICLIATLYIETSSIFPLSVVMFNYF